MVYINVVITENKTQPIFRKIGDVEMKYWDKIIEFDNKRSKINRVHAHT